MNHQWSDEILDPCGGVGDLEARRLRVIGEPAERLREDPLRILRAVRFAASRDLRVEPRTAAALRSCGPELGSLSRERVFDELTRVFTGPGRGQALQLLVDLGVADHVLPEVPAMLDVPQPRAFHPEGNVLVHVRMVLELVPACDPVLAWAAVLHDIGKPATFERGRDRIRFHGHDMLSADMADGILRRLRAPRELRETVVDVCRHHIRFASLPQMGRSKRERWLRSPRFRSHLEFHRADCLASHGDLGVHAIAETWLQELPPVPPPPLCTGRDVLALGVPEGPLVGEVLREVCADLDANDIVDRPTALEHLERAVRRRFKPPS